MNPTMCKISTLALLITLVIASPAQASTYYYSDLQREQEAIRERLNVAQRFLSEANTAYGNKLYNYSFELLAQSVVRLSRADHQIEAQIDQIPQIVRHLFVDNDARIGELNQGRRALLDYYFEINRQAQALSRDIKPHVGVDMDDVRWLIAALRYLSENHPNPQIRSQAAATLQDLEKALESGNPDAVKQAMAGANQFLAGNAASSALEGSGLGKRPETEHTSAVTPDRGAEKSGPSELPSGPATPTHRDAPMTSPTTTTPTQPRPDTLHNETVEWLRTTLATLCEQIKDPELRRRVCAMREELESAIARGDWATVARILDQTQKEIIPAVGRSQPELVNAVGDIPVNIGGKIEYFPPDFSRPGIGTRYIGGKGARLLEEIQTFLSLEGEGASARWTKRTGEKREWQFRATITGKSAIEGGQRVAFRLDEGKRQGTFSGVSWKVLQEGPNGQTVGQGTGNEGAVELTSSGSYIIQFEGSTEWGSPFRIQENVRIVL